MLTSWQNEVCTDVAAGVVLMRKNNRIINLIKVITTDRMLGPTGFVIFVYSRRHCPERLAQTWCHTNMFVRLWHYNNTWSLPPPADSPGPDMHSRRLTATSSRCTRLANSAIPARRTKPRRREQIMETLCIIYMVPGAMSHTRQHRAKSGEVLVLIWICKLYKRWGTTVVSDPSHTV